MLGEAIAVAAISASPNLPIALTTPPLIRTVMPRTDRITVARKP